MNTNPVVNCAKCGMRKNIHTCNWQCLHAVCPVPKTPSAPIDAKIAKVN